MPANEVYGDGTVHFDTNTEPINIYQGDLDELKKVVLRIQIMQTLKNGTEIFFGAVDCTLGEIARSTVVVLEKEFTQAAAGNSCALRIIIVPTSD